MASTARFDELKKKFDENPRRYFAPLANEFRKSGDAEQAVMICEEFLPQQPGHMSGHIVYGQALFDLGRLDDARTVFETALTLDPENLIALRHLGDISRAHGDPEAARHWYQRVLDADPRNEEVQALITELDGASSAPVASGAAAPVNDSGALDTTDVGSFANFGAVPPELPAPHGAAPDSLIELDVVEEHALSVTPPPRAAEPEVPFESISLEGMQPTSAAGEHGASGHAEGFEPMEFTAPAPTPGMSGLADHVESGEFTAPSAPVAPLAGLEESAVGAFEARHAPDSPVRAASEPPPLPDLEPTVDATANADDFASSPDEPPVDIPPEVIAAEAELIEVRESGSAEPTEPNVRETASNEQGAATDAAPEPPPRVTPSQPFVTETMAELYVKQGFREQALDVYKLLLAASPDNPRLRERVAALQAPAQPDAGPNVREFFARLAARRPGDRGASAEPPARDDFAALDSFDTVPEASTEAAAPEVPPARATPPETAAQEASPTSKNDGSIDALFGQRPVGQADASAASALAQAFAGGNDAPPPITGRPARAAAGELSLDSVFRDGGGRPPRSAQSFSFDQFFSESATAEQPPSPSPTATPSQGTGAQGEPAERSPDDIEQFNSWLQGLKQR